MPNSPNVRFNIVNNNVEQSTPLTGVSHVLARTLMGPKNDPSIVISSLAQFQRLFGKEVVPDGSMSNIEVALKGGSKLRISRVLASDAVKGTYKVSTEVDEDNVLVADTNANPMYTASFCIAVSDTEYLFFKLESKGYGDPITGISNQTFGVKVRLVTINSTSTLYLDIFNSLDTDLMVTPVSTYIIAKFNTQYFDTQVFKDFVENNDLVDVSLLGAKTTFDLLGESVAGVYSIDDCYELIDENWSSTSSIYDTKVGEIADLPEVGDEYGGGIVEYVNTETREILISYTDGFGNAFSESGLDFTDAESYISDINSTDPSESGYSDWRLPTLEEGLNIVEYHVGREILAGLSEEVAYASWWWTSDYDPVDSHQTVNFDGNDVNYESLGDVNTAYVFAIRKVTVPTHKEPMGNGDNYYLVGDSGNVGTTPLLADWEAAYDATKDFTDAYQLAASHVDQHLSSSDSLLLHAYIRDSVEDLKEVVYYIDVPLRNVSGVIKDYEDLVSWVNNCISTIGGSAYVSYFGGGYTYINGRGFQVDAQNLGTVLALGDASASNYGVWYSFAGANRGLVLSAKGLISPNYGSPSNYDKLNELANARVNMSVIKDTASYGKQVMLYHNFTSSVKTDSFRFLNVVRLVLYMKKNFRPILENSLEEPNVPSTWRTIHRSIMAIVNNLVSKQAITDPEYIGDQDVTSYSQLQYNLESDVRQGKYKAKLKFKDVVALQEITMDLEISKSDNTVTIS